MVNKTVCTKYWILRGGGGMYEAPEMPIRPTYYALHPSCFVGESSLIVGKSSSIVGESPFSVTSLYLLHHRICVFSTSFYFILWWVFVSVTSPFVTCWGIFVISSSSYSLRGRILVYEDSSRILLQWRHEGEVLNVIIPARREKGEGRMRRFAHEDARLRSSKHDY